MDLSNENVCIDFCLVHDAILPKKKFTEILLCKLLRKFLMNEKLRCAKIFFRKCNEISSSNNFIESNVRMNKKKKKIAGSTLKMVVWTFAHWIFTCAVMWFDVVATNKMKNSETTIHIYHFKFTSSFHTYILLYSFNSTVSCNCEWKFFHSYACFVSLSHFCHGILCLLEFSFSSIQVSCALYAFFCVFSFLFMNRSRGFGSSSPVHSSVSSFCGGCILHLFSKFFSFYYILRQSEVIFTSFIFQLPWSNQITILLVLHSLYLMH